MTLNIYEISHPIVKVITSKMNENHIEYNYKYIGLLLFYEIFRKNIETNKIYIKYIKRIKNFNVIKKNNQYIMLTNMSYTFDMISEIKIILPDIKIIHTDYKNKNNINESLRNIKIDLKNSKIFIIEKITDNDQILELIHYLNKEKKIENKNIKIGCIISKKNVLKKIGNEYSELQLYTTKII
uniref:Uracil phosphoribosyltransferase n=1 Tax=Herposiphonia versicolor TaxID=2007163 RepID=A0A1Z1MFP2_9FLOR|nr:uracil phosphoribosyltransferase [Herposiphonia versicolor]ARW64870.1 uracil phosphoribosyltransferase [Herposiphonia versicolor]